MQQGPFCHSHLPQAEGGEVFPEGSAPWFANIRIAVSADNKTVNWYKNGKALDQVPGPENGRSLKMPPAVFSDRATTVGETTGLYHIQSLLAIRLDDCEVFRGDTVEATTFTELLEQYDPNGPGIKRNITKLKIDSPLEINDLNKEKYSDVFAYVEAIESEDNVVKCIGNMCGLFSGSRIKTIQGQWDTSRVTSMQRMFRAAKYFVGDISSWDTGRVTDMSGMFSAAYNFNGDISAWNTGEVTNMVAMFQMAHSFQPVNKLAWNTTKVKSMEAMFRQATQFNGNISSWKTKRVTDMSAMFSDAINFNGDISAWKTPAVWDMSEMFSGAIKFNGNISRWKTRSVENMSWMFSGATDFNGDISSWNTEAVTDMSYMFHEAVAFNRSLEAWNTQNVRKMASMFAGATQFNGGISKWQTQNVTTMQEMFARAESFNQDISRWVIAGRTIVADIFFDAHRLALEHRPPGLRDENSNPLYRYPETD